MRWKNGLRGPSLGEPTIEGKTPSEIIRRWGKRKGYDGQAVRWVFSFHVCSVFYLWSLGVLFFIDVCGEADSGKRKGGFVCDIHI